MVYASFNLQNITAPVPPKWKNNDNILGEYKKFRHSCQRIFNGPMAHITNGKVKTNMFIIWCGPDGEDMYDNFELEEHEMYDIELIMEQFKLYCEPICNFCAARYKFQQVTQREHEMMNAFYHHIQKLCVQCQFSDDEEHLVDAIIYGTRVHKAREKLLQMPKHLALRYCLKISHHYESLSYHLNVVRLEKPVESITKHCLARGGKQQQQQQQLSAKRTGAFRGQHSTGPANSSNKTVPCSNCGTTHPKDRYLAY